MTERKESAWTIVGGGPSIEDLNLKAERYGFVVALNSAFYRFPGQVDIWSMMEKPEEMWNRLPFLGARRKENVAGTSRLLALHHPTVWTRGQYKGGWERTYGDTGIRLETTHDTLTLDLPWESEVDWMQGTLMQTLGYLLTRGAEHIRLLGVDQEGMQGWGFLPGHRGPHGSDPAWWKQRWEIEKRELSKATEEAAANGRKIVHVRTRKQRLAESKMS